MTTSTSIFLARDAIADMLLAGGEEPNVVSAQSAINDGSYATVKRYLDVW